MLFFCRIINNSRGPTLSAYLVSKKKVSFDMFILSKSGRNPDDSVKILLMLVYNAFRKTFISTDWDKHETDDKCKVHFY